MNTNTRPSRRSCRLRTWQLASACILVVATLLRVYRLELNPLHHDEGVNGFFLMNLVRNGLYRYDPANYHGPTLYYFALPLVYPLEQLQHLDTWALRAITAAFGVGVIWLILALRRYTGTVGALVAAALVAVSPGMVYNSRYFIHEMLFVCFTLGIVVAALRFYEGAAQPGEFARTRLNKQLLGWLAVWSALALVCLAYGLARGVASVSLFRLLLVLIVFALGSLITTLWAFDGPRSTYVLLGATSAGLLFATKETAFISAVTLVLATLIAWLYVWPRKRLRSSASAAKKERRKQGKSGTGHVSAWASFVARSGGWPHLVPLTLVALCVFFFINFVYYSSFFTNPKGIYDGFYVTFEKWAETGTSDFHRHPFTTYLKWLWQEEAALLMLGTLGACLAVWRGRSRFAVFAGAWAFGILLAYSLVPYKTPWLQLNFILPLALCAGYAIEVLYRKDVRAGRAPLMALAPLVVALALGLYQTYQINFVHYDDDSYVYVYAHTKREYLQLIDKVDELARRSGRGFDTNINVASPDYWPMPWYLRNYKHVGYLGRLGPTDDALVVVNEKQQAEAQALLGARYALVGSYPMRPGVVLLLYARREVLIG